MARKVSVLQGGDVVTPSEVISPGEVVIEGGRVSRVGKVASASSHPKASLFELPAGAMVLAGFIDIHMHGLGRFDTRGQGIKGIAKLEPMYGTTGFLPTLASATYQQYLDFLREVEETMELNEGARVLGAHLEGPYINPAARGAMDERFLVLPEKKEYERLMEKGNNILKLMSLSPELPGAIELIRTLRKNKIVASAGHSTADEKQMRQAIDAGLRHLCHLFNASRKMSDKEPGVRYPGFSEMCLALGGFTAEIICDTVHVHPLLVRLAARALGVDNIVAITDSMRGTGLPDGTYLSSDGRKFYTRRGDAARLVVDNKIIGSTLTMNIALKNLVEKCGFSLPEASRITSLNPARVIGLQDSLGSIEPGKLADIAVLNPEFECLMTLREGRPIYQGRGRSRSDAEKGGGER